MTLPNALTKTILLTGATDGIGLKTAEALSASGHSLILHGRSAVKLDAVAQRLSGKGRIETIVADMSKAKDVEAMADALASRSDPLDVIINNAGVLKVPDASTPSGIDLRFVVNVLAPYLLVKRLLPVLTPDSRIINLSSAAQAPVDLDALAGRKELADMPAYAQSKLALTMWSRHLADSLEPDGPLVISVNPGSLLASKMVKEGFGVSGNDLSIGADILCRLALSDEFANDTGRYFDNDAGRFNDPHPDASDMQKCARLVEVIESVLPKWQAR